MIVDLMAQAEPYVINNNLPEASAWQTLAPAVLGLLGVLAGSIATYLATSKAAQTAAKAQRDLAADEYERRKADEREAEQRRANLEAQEAAHDLTQRMLNLVTKGDAPLGPPDVLTVISSTARLEMLSWRITDAAAAKAIRDYTAACEQVVFARTKDQQVELRETAAGRSGVLNYALKAAYEKIGQTEV